MNQDPKNDPRNILLLIGSVLAIMISFLGAAGSILLGVVGLFIDGSVAGSSAWVLAGTFVGLSIVSLPAGWVALKAMQGDSPPISKPSSRSLYGILILIPPVLVVGTFAFQAGFLPGLLGPPAHMLAALLPVMALVFLVLQKGPAISQRRGWAHFMAGLWISPISALILEIIAAIPIILIILAAINASLGQDFLLRIWEQPDLFSEDGTVETILGIASQPLYVTLILGYLGILVPLIEELIKAIGLLPLIRRQISEAEGFLGGVLAGAGYGLFEALYLGQPGPSWAALMLARGGATMMHMLTAGLTGIGFARTKKEGRVWPLIRYYMIAVGLHALWNFAAVLMGIGMAGEALESMRISPSLAIMLTIGGGFILVVLSVVAYSGLRKLPRRSVEHIQPQASVEGSNSDR
jgi:RsiW-degrading membrane proteinase PrsW (M82 family)